MTNICSIDSNETIKIFFDECRENVCQNLSTKHIYQGNPYCVLHFPDANKHKNTNFNEIVEERIKQNSNNYEYVYFPVNQNFKGKNLKGKISFYNATFADEAQFGQTVFEDKVSFIHTKFEVGADFDKAVFNDDVIFNHAEFLETGFFRETKFIKKIKCLQTVFSKKSFFHDSKFLELADFSDTRFDGSTHFNNAVFHKDANFIKCSFNEYAYFSGARFLNGADYVDSIFKDKTFFYKTLFDDDVDFSKVRFYENSQIDFHETNFKQNVYFNKSIIEGYLEFLGGKYSPVFNGDKARLNLKQARVEKAKRISFRNTTLRPIWFIDVNLKDFIFLDVDWINADGNFDNTKLELQALTEQNITGRPHRLLNITCSQLATNYEENKYFEQASNFRLMSMNLVFWEKWLSLKVWLFHPLMLFFIKRNLKVRKYKLPKQKIYERWKVKKKIPYSFWQSFDVPHYSYRILSFYGESWIRALVWLVLICPIFALMFYLFGSFEKNTLINVGDYLAYSLQTMTLQKPEPKPIGFSTILIYSLEIIFTPIQLALLALAIRRKFMR